MARPKNGRPTKRVSVTLDEALYLRVEQMASEEKRAVSQMIGVILARCLHEGADRQQALALVRNA